MREISHECRLQRHLWRDLSRRFFLRFYTFILIAVVLVLSLAVAHYLPEARNLQQVMAILLDS